VPGLLCFSAAFKALSPWSYQLFLSSACAANGAVKRAAQAVLMQRVALEARMVICEGCLSSEKPDLHVGLMVERRSFGSGTTRGAWRFCEGSVAAG